MDLLSRLRLSVGALSLILSGCGPLVVAYPPVPTHGTELSGLDRGDLAYGAGANALVTITSQSYGSAAFADSGAGAMTGSVGAGLPWGVDLRASMGLKLQGLNWSFQLGKDLLVRPEIESGAVVGFGGSHNVASWSETENGVTNVYAYDYWTAVPSLAGRARLHLRGALWVPIGARVSWSQIVPGEGIAVRDIHGVLWIEAQSGLLFMGDHLGLSLDVGLIGSPTDEAIIPFGSRVGLSFQGKFDVTKRRSNL